MPLIWINPVKGITLDSVGLKCWGAAIGLIRLAEDIRLIGVNPVVVSVLGSGRP